MTDKANKSGGKEQDTILREADVAKRLDKDHTVFRNGNSRNQDPEIKSAEQKPIDKTRIKAGVEENKAKAPLAQQKAAIPGGASTPAHDATRIKMRNRGADVAMPGGARKDQTRIPASNIQNNIKATASTGQEQHRVLKDRFRLEKVIGIGGMGVVYKARDRLKVEARDREPYVAIKVLSEEFKSHPESFIALQRESRKTQRIAHPNVVKVYDFDRDGDTVFMTMEYMEGVPLDQLIKQYSATGLPKEEVWSILSGLCSALIHAHAENIVHSDFKPGNIFVTDAGVAKIFDFGIARAVANVDRHTGGMKDKTVFDAGTLGALTPAYASLEMLQGSEPDVRDDIYALGCIAYEMLTGSHPFNRMPADEAYKSKLKPKKINSIKTRQWKAIESALMFKREDRIPSVEKFYHQIQAKSRSISLALSTLLVLVAIGISTYFIVTHESKPPANDVQVDKIEFNIRYGLFKKKIIKLVDEATFSTEWEDLLWDEVSGMTALLKNKPDAWLTSYRQKIYDLYIDNFQKKLTANEYVDAGRILTNAYRYTDDPRYLDAQKTRLAELVRASKERAESLKKEQQHKLAAVAAKTRKQKADAYLFDLALKNVNQQLQCQTTLNMREFGVAVEKLRSIDNARYAGLQNNFVITLADCITHIGKLQPERAIEDKKYALRLFRNNAVIESINILPRDACSKSIAGLGARGERAVCRDKISGAGDGPAMVVIPGSARIHTFAIGKYEVSIKEINQFCSLTNSCSRLPGADGALPAVNISIGLANNYVRWLSKMTKHKYRLPTIEEWSYAAKANRSYQDPNRNCALNSRGIEKGGQLVKANTGSQNKWGLVNYLGNAREWAYDKSHNLYAVGGSFMDSMDLCNFNYKVRHSGRADSSTGFRVIREVVR